MLRCFLHAQCDDVLETDAAIQDLLAYAFGRYKLAGADVAVDEIDMDRVCRIYLIYALTYNRCQVKWRN